MAPWLNNVPAPGLFLTLFFLVPLILWLLLGQADTQRAPGWQRLIFPTLVALCSMAGCLFFVTSTEWKKNTEIAWTAIEGEKGVHIGGRSETALIGWPSHSFTPEFHTVVTSSSSARVSISLGGGFIYDETQKKYLNGQPLVADQPQTIDNFKISLLKSRFFGSHTISVHEYEKSGKEVAKFDLPSRSDRAYSLRMLIGSGPRGNIFNEEWSRLEDWAEELLLLLTADSKILILPKQQQYEAQIALPSNLITVTPTRRQRMQLSLSKGRNLCLGFSAPWRLATPPPPMGASQSARLTVSSWPLSGEHAFILPFGREAGNFRQVYDITESDGSAPRFIGPGAITSDPDNGGHPMEPPQLQLTNHTACDPQAGTVSQQRVPISSGVTIYLSTIKVLPQRALLLILMLTAIVPLVFGFWLTNDRLPAIRRWCIHGLALCLWNLLMFRLMLAFRYALDPRYLDQLAVSGLANALAALAVAPGFILLVARLRVDWNNLKSLRATERKHLFKRVIFFILLLGLVYVIETLATTKLWVNLPDHLIYQSTIGVLLTLTVAIFFLCLVVLVLYGSAHESRHHALSYIFLWPLVVIEKWIGWSANRWERLIRAKLLRPRTFTYLFGTVLFFILLPFLLVLLFSLINRIRYADTVLHDLVVPFLFCWPVALFWLASRVKIAPGQTVKTSSFWSILACAVLTILTPGFLLPVVISDPGSLYGMLAVFLPTTILLGITRIWKPFFASLCAFLMIFALVVGLYLNLDTIIHVLPPSMTPVRAVPRLLIFREGNRVQRYLPVASAGRKDEARSFHASEIRNGVQHIWENNAIAVNGGFFGLGFGQAPTHESTVRHDTLTYDSVYSFFVQSEYGLVGATGLLLLYSCPLLLILVDGRKRFGFGHAVGYLVAAAILCEALIHAAMNLAMIPYTGRNLPLLAVNSFTDLLRWTILFAIAVQAVLWHDGVHARNRLYDYPFLGVSQPLFHTQQSKLEAQPRTDRLTGWDWAVITTLTFPLLLMISITYRSTANLLDSDYTTAFTWSPFLTTIKNLIEEKRLTLDPKNLKINYPNADLPAESLLNQEITRFNAMPEEERKQERGLQAFYDRLSRVESLSGYNDLMNQMRVEHSTRMMARQRPLLFQLIPMKSEEDGKVTFSLAVNQTYNSEFRFPRVMLQDEFPKVTFRDGCTPLIGPAWVMGRWKLTYDPYAPLPWTRHLANAVKSGLEKIKAPDVLKQLRQLTLDPELQLAATQFAAEKGRAVHQRLLREERDPWRKIPPRIAISIVNLPDGEVLALGGWPRMSSEDYWVREKSGEWIPSVNWVESRIPGTLRSRYDGDRNFDLMLMGSATKPLWASVVYSLHSNLGKNFSVRGPEGEETEVFGIPIKPGWRILTEGSDWINLDEFLKRSDNRFQVRLGFLGLADDWAGNVAVDTGTSPSDRESMNGKSPWRRYPRFPEIIGFSWKNNSSMENIDATPLAEQWYRLYSVNKNKRLLPHRRSFWSNNEKDNLEKNEGSGLVVDSAFDRISPITPDFEWQSVKSPRHYVSLLLGGQENKWANVDFAAAFGTCLTGSPIIPHIVRIDKNSTSSHRLSFPEPASRLRGGLKAAAMEIGGTAHDVWHKTSAMMDYLKSLQGIDVYAKTGTLGDGQSRIRNINRIVLALVNWQNKNKGIIKTGIVLSVVGEDIGVGEAAGWASDFLMKNHQQIWSQIKN